MQKKDIQKKMSKQLSKRIENKLQKLLANTGDMALKRRAKRIIEELNPQKGDKILDVGCGDGYYLHLLSNLGLKLDLTGADFDPNALASAKRNLKGKRIKIFQADLMNKLPFKSESFDKAVMSEVVEHLPDDIEGLREVYRVLQPGGVLCLSVPNANYPFLWDPVNWTLEHLFRTHIKSGFWAGIWNQHIRLYTPQEIARIVEKAGYKIKSVKSTTFWSIPFGHNIVNLGAILLHSGKMDKSIAESVNKFKKPATKKFWVKIYFSIVETVDKLNDFWTPHLDWGVGVFVRAIKYFNL